MRYNEHGDLNSFSFLFVMNDSLTHTPNFKSFKKVRIILGSRAFQIQAGCGPLVVACQLPLSWKGGKGSKPIPSSLLFRLEGPWQNGWEALRKGVISSTEGPRRLQSRDVTLEWCLEAYWRRQTSEFWTVSSLLASVMLNEFLSHKALTLAGECPEMSVQDQMAKGLMRQAKVGRFTPMVTFRLSNPCFFFKKK